MNIGDNMPPVQFILRLCFKQVETNNTGREFPYFQCIETDLVSGDIAEFLAKIPDTIDDTSILWASLTKASGHVLTYADGVELNGERLVGEAAEDWRQQARIFAERQLEKQKVDSPKQV
jgi:hypothetical protein